MDMGRSLEIMISPDMKGPCKTMRTYQRPVKVERQQTRLTK